MVSLVHRPDALEPLPGEVAQPSLRLLERPASRARGPVRRNGSSSSLTPNWLDRLRQVARRAFAH